jgi:hypothetical protein
VVNRSAIETLRRCWSFSDSILSSTHGVGVEPTGELPAKALSIHYGANIKLTFFNCATISVHLCIPRASGQAAPRVAPPQLRHREAST